MAVPPDVSSPCSCCLDKTGLGTRTLAVALALSVHFTLGSLFNYAEDSSARFNYPNLGSSLFILATSLYATSRSLLPRSLCIRSETLQSIYKIIIVTLLTNIFLVAIWQQIVNLTIELSLIAHDILVFAHIRNAAWIKYLPCYLSHVIGAVVLVWVVTSLNSAQDGVVNPRARRQKRRGVSESLHGTEDSYDRSYERSEDWDLSNLDEETVM